jgi:hypothetical protein
MRSHDSNSGTRLTLNFDRSYKETTILDDELELRYIGC